MSSSRTYFNRIDMGEKTKISDHVTSKQYNTAEAAESCSPQNCGNDAKRTCMNDSKVKLDHT